ncbi:MAG: OsmC family protein [Bacteroidota bacterium]
MHTIETIYNGELRTSATHIKSGTEIITDAPIDNHGKGEAFSPTDLVAAAFGSCLLTIMGVAEDNFNLNLKGTKLKITKIMAENPRRIGEIIVELNFPANNYNEKQKHIIEHITRNCPVGLSLHPDIKQTIILNY